MMQRAGEGFNVLVLAPGEAFPAGREADGGFYVKYRGVELTWSRERAVLQCEPDAAAGLSVAVREFAAVEAELTALEAEIAAAWGEVERDTAVAFDADGVPQQRSDEIGVRMQRAFQRRIRFAQLESRLYAASTGNSTAGVKLGDELREKAALADRAEIVDGQLEVFEHVYEMASQRMGESRAARQGHITEVIIIWILALEAALMAGDVLVRVLR